MARLQRRKTVWRDIADQVLMACRRRARSARVLSYLLRRELAAAGPRLRGKNLYDLTFDVPPPPGAVRWSTDRS